MSNLINIPGPIDGFVSTIKRIAEQNISALTGYNAVITLNYFPIIDDGNEFNIDALAKLICHVYGLKWDDLKTEARTKKLVAARYAYCYYSRRFFNRPFQLIANDLNRDHTTAIHGTKQYQNWLDSRDSLVTKANDTIMNEVQKVAKKK
jgi:chromosomal replication initiation ATPase DnaA